MKRHIAKHSTGQSLGMVIHFKKIWSSNSRNNFQGPRISFTVQRRQVDVSFFFNAKETRAEHQARMVHSLTMLTLPYAVVNITSLRNDNLIRYSKSVCFYQTDSAKGILTLESWLGYLLWSQFHELIFNLLSSQKLVHETSQNRMAAPLSWY